MELAGGGIQKNMPILYGLQKSMYLDRNLKKKLRPPE